MSYHEGQHDNQLPPAGAADSDLARQAHDSWIEAARKAGLDLTGFDPETPLGQRVAWARGQGLDIGTVLARYSSKLQHSTADQVRDNVQAAAAGRCYVPPEHICVDEAVSGRKQRRAGIKRLTRILETRQATVLYVFMFSRIFRSAYRGFGFIQESVVDSGLRAVSVAQGIDTADEKTWRQLAYMYGIMDEMLIGAIAEHVRSGLSGLFRAGYVTGALTVGYFPRIIEGASFTNRGRPRTMPAVNEEVAAAIRQHFEWIRDGMPIAEGQRRWVRAGGPVDPRCTTGEMSYAAYRRMLSNPRYTGLWAFGRKRNRWNSRKDYTEQIEQPDQEVIVVRSDELRIIDEELFLAVQQRLDELKTGPRSPKRDRQHQLWDLVTGCFVCGSCSSDDGDHRLYQAGAHGRGMRCRRGTLCSDRVIVNRKEAVLSVCRMLGNLLQQDADLIERTVARAGELDRDSEQALNDELSRLRRRESVLLRKLEDLEELLGEGSEFDRAETKRKIRAARSERERLRLEESSLTARLEDGTRTITADDVRQIVSDLPGLMIRAADGEAADGDRYRAARLFRTLVGGRIVVETQARPERKRVNVLGRFTPRLLQTVRAALGDSASGGEDAAEEISVYLREPPRHDRLAPRVHQLIDVDGHSFRSAAKVLQADGVKINSGVVWQIHQRYWEMVGQPVPEIPYNNGNPRKS